MKKGFLLLLIFLIFLVSGLTFALILIYFDISQNTTLGYLVISFDFILLITSFLSFIFYFFKKIYYRGEVYVVHIFSSLRQGFLFSLLLLGIIVFYKISVLSIMTLVLLFIILLFIELLIQNISD